MRILVLAFALTTLLTASANAQEQPAKRGASGTPSASAPDGPKYRLFVEDGQLASHGFDVFVTPDVPADADPQFTFNRHHVLTAESGAEKQSWTRNVFAREQTRTVLDGGRRVSVTGTLLVFDAPSGFFNLQFGDHVTFLARGSVRGLPIVTWTENSAPRTVVAAGDVYLSAKGKKRAADAGAVPSTVASGHAVDATKESAGAANSGGADRAAK